MLTRANVTSASRVMLPAYPLLCLALAINYSIDAPRLMSSPALSTAARLLPLPVWGAMFALAGIVLVAGLVQHRRLVYIAGLVIMCAAMLLWTAVLTYATVDSRASFTAAAWPAFVCAACWATIRSLISRETS